MIVGNALTLSVRWTENLELVEVAIGFSIAFNVWFIVEVREGKGWEGRRGEEGRGGEGREGREEREGRRREGGGGRSEGRGGHAVSSHRRIWLATHPSV